MNSSTLLGTSAALGLMVLAGGAYGVLFALGIARGDSSLERASYACYAGQLLVVLTVCLASPLDVVWKVFIALSAIVYGFLPPATWRLLEQLHREKTR